jgi:hypothetical protein
MQPVKARKQKSANVLSFHRQKITALTALLGVEVKGGSPQDNHTLFVRRYVSR